MKIIIKILATSSIILLLFLFTTDPQKLPSVLLIVPFILLFVIVASIVPLALGRGSIPGSKTVKMGATVAAIAVLLLGLQSLGQLTARDVLAVVVLFGTVYFYTSRFGMRPAN